MLDKTQLKKSTENETGSQNSAPLLVHLFSTFSKKVGGVLVEVRLVNIIFAEPLPHEPYNPK